MLRSLDLFGFKSFADRVRFDFDPGITCVVGPNGSGKSNVVDAIKWLLGDQSAKSLRGKDMLDVVFNGSASRGPSGYAEAVLTFDNSAGLIPYATREVAVGRRLYRTGESEYLLNGDAVRLKDVRSLFMGTGAGSAAYSIIEQGRVGQILQANPAARRAVFEEAAGVSKFKARRAEAERRLARVDQNLERLRDIVDETEVRLAATRSQASKAAKYRDLTKELRKTWLGLAGDLARRLGDRVESLTAERAERTEALATLRAELAATEEAASGVLSRLSEAEAASRSADARLSSAKQAAAGIASTLAARVRERGEIASQRRQLETELRSERRRLAAREEESRQAVAELEAVAERRRTADDRTARAAAEVDELRARRDELAAARDEHLSTADTHDRRASEATVRLESLTADAGRLDGEAAELEQRLTASESAAADARAEADRCRAAVAEVRTERDVLRDRVADLRREEAAVQTEIESQRDALRAARESRTADEARLRVLVDLEPASGGYAVGANELLERADTGGPPWDTLRGRVADLLECAVEDAPLLDLALDGRAFLLVTSDLRAVLDHLRQRPLEFDGRIGFVQPGYRPAADASVFDELAAFYQQSPLADLGEQPGVLRRADSLVTNDPDLAETVLGDTWIVEDLAAAERVRALSPTSRAVTLAGETLDATGSVSVGPLPATESVIGRRTEVRELKSRIARLGRTIAASETTLAGLEARRAAVRDRLAGALAEEPETVERVGDEQSALIAAVDRHEAAALEADRVRGRLEVTREEGRKASEAVAACEATIQDSAGNAAREREEAEALQPAIGEAADALARSEDARKATEVEAISLAQSAASAKERSARLAAEVAEAEGRVRSVVGRLTSAEDRLRSATLSLLNERAGRDAALLRVESSAAACRRASGALTEAKEAAKGHQDAIVRLGREESEAASTLSVAESRHRESVRELELLAERCDEDFGLTLDDVAEEPSAYDAFCEALPEDVQTPPFEEVAEQLERDTQRLRRKIKALGSVNTDALADLDELETRFETLSAQLGDLEEAKSTLEVIIARVNTESQRLFRETFDTVRGHFQELFRKCFGGGSADLVLEEAEDVLDSGIEITARPPGKEPRNLSLLSGGEKAMTAVALLMALFRAKPSPYCILDEVDAPLDEANIDRFLNVLREFREGTQFIVITHRRRTMTAADVVYGVTMETSGVSKKLSVSLEQVAEDGAIRKAA